MPGAAGGATAQGANTQLEHCSKTLGTLTIVEEANQPWLYQLTQEYHVQSTVPLLRLIMQQSNCFVIVERGRAFANMQAERALAAGQGAGGRLHGFLQSNGEGGAQLPGPRG